MPDTLDVALKEWDTVCRLLVEGRQVLLLRKGGISDVDGTFVMKHRRFLLFPTFVHQKGELIQPWASDAFRPMDEEPADVRLPGWAEVTHVEQADDAAVQRLTDQHCWSEAQIDLRLNYRPGQPTYVALLRMHRLPEPVRVANHGDYAGCVSWVPLHEAIDLTGSEPALDDEAYGQACNKVLDVL